MASRGTKTVLYSAVQADIKVKPTTGWETFPRKTDSLNSTFELLDSETINDSRLKTPGAVISADASGDVECELIKGVYDKYIAAAAGKAWVIGSPAVGQDTLTFGGDVITMFALAKSHKDILQYHYWAGNRVNTMNLDIPEGGYASLTFGFMGSGYENAITDYVTSPTSVPVSPKVTSLNVTDIKIDGTTTKGTACATAFSFELTNNIERQNCLGAGLYGDELTEMMADMTGSITLKYSKRAQELLNKQMTAAPISIEVTLTFPGTADTYVLKIPKAQLQGDIPSSGNEILQADLTYTVVADVPADAPTLTRKFAV